MKSDTIKVSKFKCFVNIIFSVIPTIWFSVILIYNGRPFIETTIIENVTEKSLSPLGWGITVAVIVVTVVGIVIYNILGHRETTISQKTLDKMVKDKKDAEIKREIVLANLSVLNHIKTTNNQVCRTKLKTLTQRIKDLRGGSDRVFPKIISKPTLQLDAIISSIKTCLAAITKIDESHLHVSAAYKVFDSEWRWLQNYVPSYSVPITEICQKQDSTFYRLIRKDNFRQPFVFYNRKTVANENMSYHFFEGKNYDEKGNTREGSIIARHVYLGDDLQNPIIEFVIFITTHDRLIVPDDDHNKIENARVTLEEQVFEHYSHRIKIELALLTLEFLQLNKKRFVVKKDFQKTA